MLDGLNLGGMKIRRKDESGIQESKKLNPAVLQAAMGGSFMKGADGEDAYITPEALKGVKMMEGRDKMEMIKSLQRQDEVIADVDEVRGRGNDLFRAGDYQGAEGLYREAMQVVTQHMAQQVAVEDATYGPQDPCKPEAPNRDPKMDQELLNKQVNFLSHSLYASPLCAVSTLNRALQFLAAVGISMACRWLVG